MKIGIVSNLYPPNIVGGAEIVAYELANGLSKTGHDVFVITLDKEDQIISNEKVRIYKVAYRNGNFVNIGNAYTKFIRLLWRILDLQNPFNYKTFFNILSQERPDVIHCHNLEGISTSIWRCASILNIPVVQHLHDYYFICRHAGLFKKNKLCEKQTFLCTLRSNFFSKMMNKYIKTIISPSRFCYDRTMSAFSNSTKAIPKEIIYNGTSLTELPLPNRQCKDNTTLNVCYIGALTFHKGISTFIRLVEKVNEHGLDIKFTIAGKGPYASSVYDLTKKNTNVEYLGFINKDEKIKLLQNSHLLIFTSIWPENNPIVLLEAYALGLPVIASNVGGVPEIIHPGWLYNPEDELDLFFKLLEVYNNRNLLSDESKKNVDKRDLYSIESQVNATIDVYNRLLTH